MPAVNLSFQSRCGKTFIILFARHAQKRIVQIVKHGVAQIRQNFHEMFARDDLHQHGDGFLPLAERRHGEVEQIVYSRLVIGKFFVVFFTERGYTRLFVGFAERGDKFLERGLRVTRFGRRIALFNDSVRLGGKRNSVFSDGGQRGVEFVFG